MSCLLICLHFLFTFFSQNSDQSSSEDDLADRMDVDDREYKAKSANNADDVANKRYIKIVFKTWCAYNIHLKFSTPFWEVSAFMTE